MGSCFTIFPDRFGETDTREQIAHCPRKDESKFGLLTSRRQDVRPKEETTMDK